MTSPPEAPFHVVFLDCDSTLSAIEGIDELARAAGVVAQVEELTRQAMDGEVSLESVYGRRLALVEPDARMIDDLSRLYVERMVDGADEVVATLSRLGKHVHVISGGVRQAILPLASRIGIPPERVHAVGVVFDSSGRYAGYDEASPLWRNGGKAETCRLVLAASPGRAAIVGDGKTDLEARPPCDAMIGFGGVVARQVVREGADAFVDGPSLLPVLDHLMTSDERARL